MAGCSPFCPAPACLWDEDDDLHNWELVDYSGTGSEILAKPSSNGGLNQEEWPSEDMLPPPWNGGSDIHIDSHAIGATECIRFLSPILDCASVPYQRSYDGDLEIIFFLR